MSDGDPCSRCGAAPSPEGGSLEGMCPVCLLRLAADEEPGHLDEGGEQPRMHINPSEPNSPGEGMAGADALRIGQVLHGKYRIESILGRGGMGSVYRARHLELGALRAIKVVRPDLTERREVVERFRKEAVLAESLRHPNLVSLYDFASLPDGTSYIVWEYVEGQTLSRLMARGVPLTTEQCVDIVGHVADGLAAAHRKGILHRDISPDNIMIVAMAPRPAAKVLDFGIAKVVGPTEEITTGYGVFVGKIGYASPEQTGLLGDDEPLDARTDVFSLAVVAYLMLTGERPFRTTTLQVYLQDVALRDEEDVRRQVLRRLSDPWRPVFARSLSRSRRERTPSMEALKADFEAAALTRRSALAASLASLPARRGPAEYGPGNSVATTRTLGLWARTMELAGGGAAAPARRLGRALPWAVVAALPLVLALTWLARSHAPEALGRPPLPLPSPHPSSSAGPLLGSSPVDTGNAGRTPASPKPEKPREPRGRPEALAGAGPLVSPSLSVRPEPAASSPLILSGGKTLTKGELVLSSDPKASIAIDGTPSGVTPLRVEVSPGTHRVLFMTPDGLRWEEGVEVPAGEVASLHRSLGAFGKLSVTSDVWAEVSLDGGPSEQTPISFARVPAGPHRIRAVRQGYKEQVLLVTVEEGKTTAVALEMEKRP